MDNTFYEPSNWIPFIFYFAVSAICGYVRLKNTENVRFMKAENKLILDKFLFAREMYQETLRDKRQYKKQIREVETVLVRFLTLRKNLMSFFRRIFLSKRFM